MKCGLVHTVIQFEMKGLTSWYVVMILSLWSSARVLSC